ncbi:acyl-CoA dehydrogenase family protein [Nocardioides hungaricus]
MVDRAFEPEALEYGRVVRTVIEAAGGLELVVRSSIDHAATARSIDATLAGAGVWDLAPLEDEFQLQASAESCRVAGAFALPCPVAERLGAHGHLDVDAVALVGRGGRVSIAEPSLRWMAVDQDAATYSVQVPADRGTGRLGAFVVSAELTPTGRADDRLLALLVTLNAHTLLGMMQGVVAQTRTHAQTRHQFGAPLVSFQAIQYQLADAWVAVQAVEEMGRYALWSLASGRDSALLDAVALRSEALHAASTVFRTGHQVHGATGFCDETPVSWLSRHSLALRELPTGVTGTDAWLLGLIEAEGFDGLFGPRGGSPHELTAAARRD